MLEPTGRPEALSTRLIQVLRVYLYMGTLTDLRDDITAGRHPWLRDEFATALRTGALTADVWRTHIAPGTSIADSDATVREQQQHVWRTLFPDETLP